MAKRRVSQETVRETDYTEQVMQPCYSGSHGLEYRARTIKAGDYMEVDLYPAVEITQEVTRNRKQRRMTDKARRANVKARQKYLGHLMNANFGADDLILTLTTSESMDLDEANRHKTRFIRRLKYRAKKRGHELHCLGTPETTGSGERQRWHIHMVMDGGWISREEIENIWKNDKGHGLVRTDRVQEQPQGLVGFARYITKNKESQNRLLKRAWFATKNLKKPKVSVSKSKFTRKSVESIRKQAEENANIYFEKAYPGYRLIMRPEISYSEFLPGAYITAWMEKTKGGGTK